MPDSFNQHRSGHYEPSGDYNYFIPSPLPPAPPLVMDMETIELYGEALNHLGKLDLVIQRIPNTRRFLGVYITKEALLSSQIEGTQTSLIEVFEYEAKTKAPGNADVEEVLNYVQAVEHAYDEVIVQGLPIVSRIFRSTHGVLLSGTRGKGSTPGEYRKIPVWIGSPGQGAKEARLVPPPTHKIEELIKGLEEFINANTSLPPLIRAGLAHVQFETIHPFLDGNGRLGRLLIVLMLMKDRLLSAPLLYLSLYFKENQVEYYARLQAVRTKSDWEGWVKYFLTAVRDTAENTWKRAEEIEALQRECADKIKTQLPRLIVNASTLLDYLFLHPVVTIPEIVELTNTTYPTAQKLITSFVALDILSEETQKTRDKVFRFHRYVNTLERNDQ